MLPSWKTSLLRLIGRDEYHSEECLKLDASFFLSLFDLFLEQPNHFLQYLCWSFDLALYLWLCDHDLHVVDIDEVWYFPYDEAKNQKRQSSLLYDCIELYVLSLLFKLVKIRRNECIDLPKILTEDLGCLSKQFQPCHWGEVQYNFIKHMPIRFFPRRYDKEVLRRVEEVIDSASSDYDFKELLKIVQESVSISLDFLIWVDTLSLQEGLKRGILPIFRIDLGDTMIGVFLLLDFYVLMDL